MKQVTIVPADNGYIVSDGSSLMIATTLQEALSLVMAALGESGSVFIAYEQSRSSH